VYGCSDRSDPYTVVSLGYAETQGSTLRVVPNPAGERFTIISLDVLPTDAAIDMIDVNGQVVRRLTSNGASRILVPRGSLAAGLYMIRAIVPGMQPVSSRVVLE